MLCSCLIFLFILDPNAGVSLAYVDLKPNTAASHWGHASLRRSLREDACGERLRCFNFSAGAGSSGGSIRACGRHCFRNIFSPPRSQAKETATLSDRIYTILAVTLLQTLGLFHQHAEQRSTAMLYHSMLVAVGFPVAPRRLR